MSDGTAERNTQSRLPRALALLVLIPAVTTVVAIAFGVVPEAVFDAGCVAGRSVGTELACYGFVWNAVTTGVFIGATAPLIGTYLVYREMALIGETLAHTAFAGVAIGTLLLGASGWETTLVIAALGAAVVGALVVQELSDRTVAHGDVPIAVVLTGSFAVGALAFDLGGGFASVDVNSYLFGSITLTDDRGVSLIALLSLAVVGVVAVTHKQLLFVTFDPQAARVARLHVSWYNALLIVLTAVVVVGAMQILGVILVAALLVVPVAAAGEVARSFRSALYGSILIGEASVLAGLALSFRYGLRPGATIVVIAIGIYLVAVTLPNR